MTETTLAFIGGGNMTRSLIGGLVSDGWNPARIHVADPDPQQLELLARRFSVATTTDNGDAVNNADAVVLAIKPQMVRPVATELAPLIRERRPLVISIAAGIREASLRGWLDRDIAIVRAMPNTPAMVQSGATALYANPTVSEAQHNLAESVLRAVGVAIWVLSGSGPAYFFLLMEALTSAGLRLGLPQDTARLLTLQTAFGAAKMALESVEDAAQLRHRVTSPGGTTERAIGIFQENNFEGIVLQAMQAATARSRELAAEFGKG